MTGVAGLAALCVAGWLALFRPAPPLVAPPATSPVVVAPVADIAQADEAAILAAGSPALEVFRFRAAPEVLVLSFPTLREQGRMLNRLGAFVEKAGLPRDRVLADPEMDDAVRRAGDTEETFYYGHDYRAADAARFFAAAERDGVPLRPEEARLRALLGQQRMLAPGAVGAIISLPPEMADPPIDAPARATILRHELSHGVYFTNPAYAAYARRFWETVLSDAQRAGFRRFLGGEGYDTSNEDLMRNEAQAYLIHTPDARFFRPDLVGLTGDEAAELREAFVRGMPDGWLKDATPLPASP